MTTILILGMIYLAIALALVVFFAKEAQDKGDVAEAVTWGEIMGVAGIAFIAAILWPYPFGAWLVNKFRRKRKTP